MVVLRRGNRQLIMPFTEKWGLCLLLLNGTASASERSGNDAMWLLRQDHRRLWSSLPCSLVPLMLKPWPQCKRSTIPKLLGWRGHLGVLWRTFQLSLSFTPGAWHVNEEAVLGVDAFSPLPFESLPANWGLENMEQKEAVHTASHPNSWHRGSLSIRKWWLSYATKFEVVH